MNMHQFKDHTSVPNIVLGAYLTLYLQSGELASLIIMLEHMVSWDKQLLNQIYIIGILGNIWSNFPNISYLMKALMIMNIQP